MRKYRHEQELKDLAQEISERIAVRRYDNGNSVDTWRTPTKRQKKMMHGIVYGALLALNYGEATRSSADAANAIIDAAEFQADILLRDTLREGEELQGYMCVYLPLHRALAAWEQQ